MNNKNGESYPPISFKQRILIAERIFKYETNSIEQLRKANL